MCCQITLCYWWQLKSLRLILCWLMWISSNHTNTWNLKFKNKNNKCQYMGSRVEVDFKRRILIQRWKMKTVYHRWVVMKKKGWKILRSKLYWLQNFIWWTTRWRITCKSKELVVHIEVDFEVQNGESVVPTSKVIYWWYGQFSKCISIVNRRNIDRTHEKLIKLT